MAFRFRREGDYIKRRVNFERSGVRNFMDDLKWELMNYHYEKYMSDIMQKSLLTYQNKTEYLQYMLDIIANIKNGGNKILTEDKNNNLNSSKFTHKTKRFFFRNCIPITIPYLRTSNPFCVHTPNKTGWKNLFYNKKITYPQPCGKHKIGGTDPLPPVFPRNV